MSTFLQKLEAIQPEQQKNIEILHCDKGQITAGS